jgi:hypothetical protein
MANAKISIPGGISVELDGTPDEISAVLDNLKNKQTVVLSVAAADNSAGKSRGEIAGLIDTLKSEDFFRTPRRLPEVQEKLAEVGHHFPLTTLSGAMQSQSKRRNLRRFKRDGKYVYVQ